jgi:hypothetical protein
MVYLVLSIIMIGSLSQIYLVHKQLYRGITREIDTNFDLQWINDLLADGVRRAGFTPCLRVDHLDIVDTRSGSHDIQSFKFESKPKQMLQINRMHEEFAEVAVLNNEYQITTSSKIQVQERYPIVIADCEHAEIHRVLKIEQLTHGSLITLTKPLVFTYPARSYIGEWIEERWFVRSNSRRINALYYQLHQSEELSPLVHSLLTQKRRVKNHDLLDITLGLDEEKVHKITVGVRGS